jgi:hypothetical protein
MRKTVFLFLIVAMTIGSCAQENKSPIEGAWKLIYFQWYFSDTQNYQFPGDINWSQIKIWSKEYFTFVGQYKLDTIITDNYGGGKYKLEGDRYEEDVTYHASKEYVGNKVKILLEIRNDTLIQKWPVDDNWKLQEKYNTEKYIRLK